MPFTLFDGELPELAEDFEPPFALFDGELSFADGERPEVPDNFDELIGRLDLESFSTEEINDTLLLDTDYIESITSDPLLNELTISTLS